MSGSYRETVRNIPAKLPQRELPICSHHHTNVGFPHSFRMVHQFGLDIDDNMMPMFWKDPAGKELMPPSPLSFHRANEGRPPQSTALAALPLVNIDCLQLARAR